MRVIECRGCRSPYCDGCNIHILATMLREGKLDCLMDEHHTITIDPDDLRPKGHWKRVQDSECYWFECSNCGEQPLRRYNHDCFTLYCPFCGARMEDAERLS